MNSTSTLHPVKTETDPPGLSVSPYLSTPPSFGPLDRPIEIDEYRNDTVLRDPQIRMHPTSFENRKKRGKVKRLSPKSQKRMAFVANNTDIPLRGMLTLTYQADVAPTDGKIAKKHLGSWLDYWRRSGYGEYLWFLEFTKRESVHFHLFTQAEPLHPRIKVSNGAEINLQETREFSQRWSEIVSPGGVAQEKMSRSSVRFEAVREIDGAGRYAAKYAFKREQKLVPAHYCDVGRFWGASKAIKPTPRSQTTITAKEAYERYKAFYVEERNFNFFYGIQHASA